MDLKPPVNENYAAVVVCVRSVVELPGLDRLVGVPVLGYQAITTKDVKVGDLMLLFPAETQLSHNFAGLNNLYRHSEMNENQEVKGYLEDNRRVRAIKFRGHRSDALLMPLSSVEYTGIDVSQLREGDTFDELDGHPICNKYVVKSARVPGQALAKQQVMPRVSERHFPLHFDTPNYFRLADLIDPLDEVVITQKLHGTSVRIGHVPVARKQSRFERALKWLDRKLFRGKLGVKVQETEYAYVYGSRRVVKDPENPFQQGFYEHDVYSEVGRRLEGALPKGFVVYGEIIGWAGNRPIQPGYTYQLPVGASELYVYRVTYVTEDGRQFDLPWDQVKLFCAQNGVRTVPELERAYCVSEDWVTAFLDRRFVDSHGWVDLPVPTEEGTVDEGVCLRVDGMRFQPLVLKAKSPIFLQHETKQLDKGEVGMDDDADQGEWLAIEEALEPSQPSTIDGEIVSVETVEETPVEAVEEPEPEPEIEVPDPLSEAPWDIASNEMPGTWETTDLYESRPDAEDQTKEPVTA